MDKKIEMRNIARNNPKKFYEELSKYMRQTEENKKKIILDFKDTPILSTSFVEKTIGKLVKNNLEKNGAISVKNIELDNLRTLRLVIARAKLED